MYVFIRHEKTHRHCDHPDCKRKDIPFNKFSEPTRQEDYVHGGLSNYKGLVCPHCPDTSSRKTYCNKTYLQSCITKCHGVPDGEFKCSRCPVAFSKADDLKQHMYTHEPMKCNVEGCTSGNFTSTESLKVHMGAKHPELRSDIYCEVVGCGRKFTSQYGLAQHTEMVHRRAVNLRSSRLDHEEDIIRKMPLL